MSNPLVAQPKDDTKEFSGIQIAESVAETKKAIESGDWAGGVLGTVGTALDALGMAMDPFGAILSAGVGWLIEHVGPLSDALDELTGDPEQIKAHSETWKNVAGELTAIKTELADSIKKDTEEWTGEAGDAYRKRGEDTGKLLTAAESASTGAADGVGTAGEVVGAVRTLVRDIIADLVGHLVSWALQVAATLGVAMAWVVPQAVNAVAKTASQIADITKKLVKALQKLQPLLKKLGDGFKDAADALKKIKADGNKSPGPKPQPGGKNKGGDPPPKNEPAGTSSQGADNAPPPKTDSPPPPKNTPPPTDRSLDGGGPTPAPSNPSASRTPPKGDQTASNNNKPNNPNERKTEASEISTGGSEPVDMANGHMVMTEIDLEIQNPLSLVLERMYVSSYRAGRWFGPTWTSTLDQRLEIDEENICYFSPDGMILVYPLPSADSPVLPVVGPRWPLSVREGGGYRLENPQRARTMYFAPLGSGTRIQPLLAILDEQGNRIDVEQQRFGPPQALQHSDGYRVEIDSEGERVTAVRVVDRENDLNVPVMRYGYDDRRRLTEVVNSSGKALRYLYDNADRLNEWQDRNGFWFRYIYDELGRVVRTVGDQGFFDSSFAYIEDGDRFITQYTDSLGGIKEFEFNAAKQLVRETDGLGNTTLSEWDGHDRLLARTDPLGRTTHYEYDGLGRPTTITRPDGSVVALELNETGTVASIRVTDGDQSWTRVYDDEHLDPFSGKVGIAPELDFDDLRSERGPDRTEPRTAEPDRRLLDLFGRPRETATPDGSRIQLGWTVDGHQSWRVDSLGGREQWKYDPEGNQIARIDPLGSVTALEYGPFETEVADIDENGDRTERTFDTERRLTSVTNPQGQTWRYVYDLAGRVIEETDFDGRTLCYEYDAAGRLVRSINGLGEVTDYIFDALGNLTEWRAPSNVTEYTYSPVGYLTKAINGDAVLEFERDAEGRITGETINERTVVFEYDDTNNAVHRRTPSGVDSSWVYDAPGIPTVLTFDEHSLNFTHDAAGKPVTCSIDGSVTIQQTYDSEQRLVTQVVTGFSGKPVLSRSFQYRPDGELIGTDDGLSGSIRYQIDRTGRVVEVISPNRRENYRYDGTGNILATGGVADVATGSRRYSGNRLIAAGAVRFRYDAQGRMVLRDEGGRTWQYSWDSYDRLVAVTTPEGVVWQYRYEPLGRRIAKQRLAPGQASGDEPAVVERIEYVWDGGTLIEQVHTDARGRRTITTWTYHPEDDAPVAQLERAADGSRRFFSILTDTVGTPTDLIDPNGSVAWHGRTSLWGKEVPMRQAAGTPLRFPGQYADAETGLNYNVYRYYDPATGRYISPDPLGLAPAPNPASYVDNPHSATDPLGLMKKLWNRVKNGRIQRIGGGPQRRHGPPPTAPQNTNPGAANNAANLGRPQRQGGPGHNATMWNQADWRYEPKPGWNDYKGSNGVHVQMGPGNDASKLGGTGGSTSGSAQGNSSNTAVHDLNTHHRNEALGGKWIKGHLWNDNLGGPAESANLTPMSHTANNNYSNQVETPLKNAIANARMHHQSNHNTGEWYGIDLKVTPEGQKWPTGSNAEQTVAKELNVESSWIQKDKNTGIISPVSNLNNLPASLRNSPLPNGRFDPVGGGPLT